MIQPLKKLGLTSPPSPRLWWASKKIIIIAAVILAFLILGVLTIRFLSGEDNWICQKGEWVKHGVPSSPKSTTPCN